MIGTFVMKDLINKLLIPFKSSENLQFPDDFRGIELNPLSANHTNWSNTLKQYHLPYDICLFNFHINSNKFYI